MPERVKFEIGGMHCASCARTIEKAVGGTPGIASIDVDFGTRLADVTYDPGRLKPEKIAEVVGSLGYSATPEREGPPAAGWNAAQRRELAFCVAAAALIYVVQGGNRAGVLPSVVTHWAGFVLASVTLWHIGRRYFQAAFAAATEARMATMDTLIALSTGSTYLYSLGPLFTGPATPLYFDATVVILAFIHTGNLLKIRALNQAHAALREVASTRIQKVRVIRKGIPRMEMAEHIFPDDIVKIRPGEKIPADGEILEGESTVIESMLTGEPMPARKGPGDTVRGGTINQFGALTFKATKAGAQTMQAAIEQLVIEATRTKPRLAELGDRIAGWFVPAALALAGATCAGWLLAGAGFARSLEIAVAVLATACPCALTLAPGTALAVSLGRAAREGLLVKSATAMDKARAVTLVAFDKTGTLTQGTFEIVESFITKGFTLQQVLQRAASVEAHSEHPAAATIEAKARAEDLQLLPVQAFKARSGRGVEGTIDGERVLVGSPRLLEEEGIDLKP